MPDLVQWALLAVVGGAAFAVVGWPLLRSGSSVTFGTQAEVEAEARALRHRIALDALLDVEADRRAGSLDDASYERERADAEERAAQTLVEASPAPSTPPRTAEPSRGRRFAAWIGVGLGIALVLGFALPAPPGLAERTVVNQALADELAREAARQADIKQLLTALAANPHDAQVLSDLADAYLAGSSAEDLRRAAVALQVLIAVEPGDRSAYQRLITAYISAGDWPDATAATDSYAGVAGPAEPDIPFFKGLIAFRSGDSTTAVQQFDRFLQLAPNDARGSMVTSLRAEAAGELPGSSDSPGS